MYRIDIGPQDLVLSVKEDHRTAVAILGSGNERLYGSLSKEWRER